MDIRRNVTIPSWDGTWTYRPAVVVTPHSVDDLVHILIDRERFPSPVRPAGSMHSTARMNGDDGGTMVDMRSLRRIIEITDSHARVEGGASYLEVTNALKQRGLQFHVTTEIGNATLAAMATAATKDSSFPGGFGQVSSYVSEIKFVAPDGRLRHVREADDPQEMQRLRSSYGLAGIVYEVTIAVRPMTAVKVRHHEMDLAEFRRRFADWKAQGHAVMYYLFPYAGKVVVELRQDNPGVRPKARRVWQYRNRFWRKYGPALALWIKRRVRDPERQARALDAHFRLLRLALVHIVRSDRAYPWAQTINYLRQPGPNKYLFSMWAFPEAGFFDVLDDYFAFCRDHYARTGYRTDMPHVGYSIAADRKALLSYCWDGPTLSIDPCSTGGKEWEDFLRAYNAFCSSRGGQPLFNQTPFLTPAQAVQAFADRLGAFARWRAERDPDERMLDSYFRELLAAADRRPAATGGEDGSGRSATAT